MLKDKTRGLATRSIHGHSDLTAGTLMGSKADLMPVWNWRWDEQQVRQGRRKT